MIAWLNGDFTDYRNVTVNLLSHSFSRGTAAFEVIDIVMTDKGPALFGLTEHIERLFNSAGLMYMDIPLSREDIEKGCIETARKNRVSEGCAKIFVYYPDIEFSAIPGHRNVDVAIFTADLSFLGLTREKLAMPARAGISSYRKMHPDIAPVQAKVSGNYVTPYLSLMEIREKGYDDVILPDMNGNLTEGATSSVFFIINGEIRTARLSSVLRGITRMAICDLINELKIPFREGEIRLEELEECEEAFYSGSMHHIQPIISIDGKDLGPECPGPVTGQIMNEMNRIYSGKNPKYLKWLTLIDG